jgi:hypothetical protein
MSLFGSANIGICAQCRNKAEIRTYPNDNPEPICEACYKSNQELEKKISDKAQVVMATNEKKSYETSGPIVTSDEREHYIRTICNKADDKWLERFITEVVTKKVLIYDWKTIIRNERWFSILDLRRFALEVDPDLDAPKIAKGFKEFQATEPIVVKRRGRKPKATKELLNA